MGLLYRGCHVKGEVLIGVFSFGLVSGFWYFDSWFHDRIEKDGHLACEKEKENDMKLREIKKRILTNPLRCWSTTVTALVISICLRDLEKLLYL